MIVQQHGGAVPCDLDALVALPGVGAYTSRAVLAFAWGQDAAPVDTNVGRVIARAVAGRPLARRELQELADALVPAGAAALAPRPSRRVRGFRPLPPWSPGRGAAAGSGGGRGLAAAARLADRERLAALTAALVAEGPAEWRGQHLRLPC